MPTITEDLTMRVLLCFLKSAPEDCTVTGISHTLKEEKYKISRAVIELEKEGLVDRSDQRHPILTETGRKQAEELQSRTEISLSHLLYEGVSLENAQRDAYVWAKFCSDETMNVIRGSEERYRVKYELRDQKTFSGAELCKKMRNGTYQLPFLIYREQMKNGSSILSMANEGFEHPCTLVVEKGVGSLQLRPARMSAKSKLTGSFMRGQVTNLRYFVDGHFVSAESKGKFYSFPAEALSFVNVGDGIGQVLHGTVCLQMDCTVGIVHMPTSKAIFTLLI